MSEKTRKLRGASPDLETAFERWDVSHVLVSLPNASTPAALVRVIEAGKSVFTEKPAARSAAEFGPVLDALKRRPVPFAVAYLNRGAPAIVEARELYQAGAIGRLLSVELRMVTTRVGLRNPASWLFQREQAGGGILAWLACHWLDALRFITGEEIVRVQAELGTLSGEAIDVEDTAVLAFRTSSGAIGSLHAGYLLALGNPGYRAAGHDISLILRGSDGLIQYSVGRNYDGAPLVLESLAPRWRSASRRGFHLTPTPSPGYGGLAGLDVFRQFLSAEVGQRTPADAVDALRVLEVLDAAYASADRGCAIEVEHNVVAL
jgi:predicted dehydrogenase